jgi:hypothetical protein
MRIRRVIFLMVFGILLLGATVDSVGDACTDADDDGVCADVDCDDSNPHCTLDCHRTLKSGHRGTLKNRPLGSA